MSETKHTPGPWNVETPFQEPGPYVAGPNTALVAKLVGYDNAEANARLIAAAPQLLAALKKISSIGQQDAAGCIGQECAWIAMKAINQAEAND